MHHRHMGESLILRTVPVLAWYISAGPFALAFSVLTHENFQSYLVLVLANARKSATFIPLRIDVTFPGM
jgi:hypothetical protein